jgi:mannose/fructose/N-acetylgalactosamine-specific phosphotransferase system component IIC
MVSRPIVVGPLFGYLLGDIMSGVWLGIIVEMVWVNVIPMGASVPPDTTAIAILSAAWGIRAVPHHSSAMVLALALAVPAAVLFRLIDVAQRYLHVRIARWVQEGKEDTLEKRVSYGVYAGFILFFLKAFIFYSLLIYPGTLLTREIYMHMPVVMTRGMALAWRVLPMVGLAYMLRNFNGSFLCFKK